MQGLHAAHQPCLIGLVTLMMEGAYGQAQAHAERGDAAHAQCNGRRVLLQ